MRAARLILPLALLLVAAAPALAGGDAQDNAVPGTLAIEAGSGVFQIKGRGVVIGRVERGWIQVVDASPADPWSPRVNGVPRGRSYVYRGTDVNFIIPGGRFKILIRGEGISISARGDGLVQVDGDASLPGALAVGTIQVGDGPAREIPDQPVRVTFGGTDQDGALQATSSRFSSQS